MSNIKNKQTIYYVERVGIDSRSAVCCFALTFEGASRLAQEYQQQFVDAGGDPETTFFHIGGNVFYDE